MGCVGKPNLVKDFCPRLPLDFDFDIGLGQAFQKSFYGASILISYWLRLPLWDLDIAMSLGLETFTWIGSKPHLASFFVFILEPWAKLNNSTLGYFTVGQSF